MTTNKNHPLRSVCGRYGAPMGRRDTLPDDPAAPVRLSLVRLRLVDYDYDAGGAYWGGSSAHGHIWRAVGDGGDVVAEMFVRAKTRGEARAAIAEKIPGARFYR